MKQNNLSPDQLKRQSKFLSLILRHKPDKIGLTLDSNGWADVDELIEKSKKHLRDLSFETLQDIVLNNDKKRFTFNEDETKIRANQGHSIEVDVEPDAAIPTDFLYHGTIASVLENIRKEGLKKMNRLHVHLSKDIETATKVGSRRGKAVILKVDALKMHQDGHAFYVSKNGVWLCDEVPPNYIQFDH